jgi:hypothetical protein
MLEGVNRRERERERQRGYPAVVGNMHNGGSPAKVVAEGVIDGLYSGQKFKKNTRPLTFALRAAKLVLM